MRMPLLPLALLACCSSLSSIHAQSTTPNDVLVERLHKNSSLYEHWDNSESMRTKANRIKGNVSKKIDESENPVQCFPCIPDDPRNDELIKMSVSASDLVATGKVIHTLSMLTPKEAFIFSDAQFIPDSVWYQSSENFKIVGNSTGKELTVTFPGGHVEVDGHKLEAGILDRPALKTGRTYLLFLKYLPESHSYSLAGMTGFDLTEPTVTLLSADPEYKRRPIMADRDRLLEAVRNSVDRAKLEAQK